MGNLRDDKTSKTFKSVLDEKTDFGQKMKICWQKLNQFYSPFKCGKIIA